MEIVKYRFGPKTRPAAVRLFRKLHQEGLYSHDGVFSLYFRTGEFRDYNRASKFPYQGFVSVAYEKGEIVGVCVLPKKQFYGWQYLYDELERTYGFIGCYVKRSHRKKGIATKLLNETLKYSRVRKVTIMGHIAHLVEESGVELREVC